MSSSAVSALFFSLFLIILSSADAFNITKILSNNTDLSTFSNYLTQTGLASQINGHQTITVLAVANGAVSALSGLSTDAIKKSLGAHVMLDYYDADKIKNMRAKTVSVATLFQQSGLAQKGQGYVNVSHSGNGPVVFKNAARGSNQEATLVDTITAQPYNISVLQISNVIFVASNSTGTPPAPVPTASPPRKAMAPSPRESSPAASPPSLSDVNAPSADSLSGSPSNSVADGPGAGSKSSAVSVTSAGSTIVMVLGSAWFLLTLI